MTTTTAPRPTPTHAPYPAHVEAAPEPHVSRWLWLVKWVLVIPHVVVLAFLWLAFGVLSLAAFVAILATGRYPRAIFDFNAGVMRWSWRVSYYAYGAIATDRYPPFTLADVPDYPAHFDVDYPDHLSRGLVLVKWWLLAIPHYVIVAILVGGGTWAAQDRQRWQVAWSSGGVVGVLVLVTGVILAVTGRYPRPLYDLLLGLNRWVLRVGAYVGLMTDVYPPFRLDLGPHDPDGHLGPVGPPTPSPSASPSAPHPTGHRGWTAGRITSLVAASLVAVLGLAIGTGGFAMLVADRAWRDTGFITTSERLTQTPGYAVVATSLLVDPGPGDVTVPARILGDVRLRVTAAQPSSRVFVGIGPSDEVDAYLAGVARAQWTQGTTDLQQLTGSAPATPPTELGFWSAQAVGAGEQTVLWTPQAGDWSVVVMNADASAAVATVVDAGAELPWLGSAGVAVGLLGLLVLAGGAVVVAMTVRRVSRDVPLPTPTTAPQPGRAGS